MANQNHWIQFERNAAKYRSLESPLYGRTWFGVLTLKWFQLKAWLGKLFTNKDVRDVWFFNRKVTEFILKNIRTYVVWQAEHGRFEPPEFKKDPASWLVVITTIETAFELRLKELTGTKLTEEEEKIAEEGMMYFAKYYHWIYVVPSNT